MTISVRFKDSYLPVGHTKALQVEIDAEIELGNEVDEHQCLSISGLLWDSTKKWRFQMPALDLNTVALYQLDDWRVRACEIAEYEQHRECEGW